MAATSKNENDTTKGEPMRAAIFAGPRRIEVGERPDPVILESTDAVVRIVVACVCGSDLWYYRGQSPHEVGAIGHEFVGVVERIGPDVRTVSAGDLVIAPFAYSDGTCPNCRAGVQTACLHGGFFGGDGLGGQAERVRVPLADGTLVKVPEGDYSDETLRSLLALSDVMGTGHHAVVSAYTKPGDKVAVVGDGAVGLCSVLAAKRLGAGRIIALSRNPERQALAREFGATDIVAERGEVATQTVLALTDGVGADAVAECVGTADAFSTAVAIGRPGSMVGYVGVPHGVEVPIDTLFYRNIGVKGGSAPVRAYLPELLDDVLSGRINPGRVFDFETDLDGIAAAYAAMDERRAIKALVRPAAA
jgi:threonine dehydrogenase-like Zn-dependent dehydrogenase